MIIIRNNIKNIIFVFIVHFVLISIAESQTISKVVQFTESEKVDGLNESENYVGAMISVNSFQALPRAILFNKKGEKVLDIYDPNIRSPFLISEPVESLGYFITIRRGRSHKLDLIRAFDINTGQEVWQTSACAGYYELSPNKKYMITTSEPGIEMVPWDFEIIDLKDGSRVDFGYKYKRYCSTWLDDERIIFVFQEYNKTKKKESDIPKDPRRERQEKKSELSKKSFQLKYKHEHGLISDADYKKQKQELDELEAELERTKPKKIERSPDSRRIISSYEPREPHFPNYKTIKLILYNMTTNSIEREEYLYKGDGSKIIIGEYPSGSNTITVDKEKNIYIYGSEYIETNPYDYLVKFSENLDFIWTTKENISNLVSFYVDDDIYFRSYIRGDVNLIDSETGKLIPVDEAKKSNSEIQDVDFSYHYRTDRVKVAKNVNTDYKNKTITFFKENQ